jgi:surfactin synthase thioesterase subunit
MEIGMPAATTWLRYFGARDTGELRLFCFHYAGGNASMFRTWPTLLPAEIEPVAIALPGRIFDGNDQPHHQMAPLVAELIEVLKPLLDKPFACYGHSMGARVAVELSYALRDAGLPAPQKLFVASSAAPALRLPVRGWDEPDEKLVEYLRELGGTPQLLFDDTELLALFLPTLRADLTVIGDYRPPADRPPLAVPIRAFSGARDLHSPVDTMRDWARETSAEFDLDVVSGGHFFDQDGIRHVIETTTKDLLNR